MADMLQAVLRCASDVVHTPMVLQADFSTAPGTAAELRDGMDGSGSIATATTLAGQPPALGTLREEWLLDPAAVVGDISFIRIGARFLDTNDASPPPQGGTASYQPSINGTSRGVAVGIPRLVVGTSDQQFDTDPDDGLPWTNAKLTVKRFGWYITATSGLLAGGVVDAMLTEYQVEAWGPAPAETAARAGRPYTVERLTYMRAFAGLGGRT